MEVAVCAEVVELADTPSKVITLAILYKLLILHLLPLSSIASKNPEKHSQYPPFAPGCKQSMQNPVRLIGEETAHKNKDCAASGCASRSIERLNGNRSWSSALSRHSQEILGIDRPLEEHAVIVGN